MELIQDMITDAMEKEFSIKKEDWGGHIIFVAIKADKYYMDNDLCFIRIGDDVVSVYNAKGRWLKKGVRRDLYKELCGKELPDIFRAPRFASNNFELKYEMCDPKFNPEDLIKDILFLVKCIKAKGGRPAPGI